MTGTLESEFEKVTSLAELREKSCVVAKGGRHGIAVFHDNGRVYAVDNRCPHMGFPLSRGTLKEGILTCHWHHARFDLSSGGTFDPWADDVRTYPIKVVDGEVWLNTKPVLSDMTERWKSRLGEGLEQGLSLVMAKQIIAMLNSGTSFRELLRVPAIYGCRNRDEGWGSGLTILTAMANIFDRLAPDDKVLAIFHGVVNVSRDTRNHPPRIPQQPLASTEASLSTLKDWFREFVEVRDSEAAERCLLTAIELKASPSEIADMMYSAITDHFFLDGGHVLDFTNKAFELLDHVGWEYAKEILPTLVRGICEARRHEEDNSWRHPIDLVPLLHDSFGKLPILIQKGEGRRWNDFNGLTTLLLSESPQEVVKALEETIANGAEPSQLSLALAFAACTRIARFHTQNEFADWITVLHTFTYCNAVHMALKRTRSQDVMRAIFHGAMKVYLDRFMNVPPASLPSERKGAKHDGGDRSVLLTSLLKAMDVQQQVEKAAELVYDYLKLREGDEDLMRTLAHTLLREDAEFHSIQMLEAVFRLYDEVKEYPQRQVVLIAVARYLSAHSPTPRAMLQTATIAWRLNRGEDLYLEQAIS